MATSALIGGYLFPLVAIRLNVAQNFIGTHTCSHSVDIGQAGLPPCIATVAIDKCRKDCHWQSTCLLLSAVPATEHHSMGIMGAFHVRSTACRSRLQKCSM